MTLKVGIHVVNLPTYLKAKPCPLLACELDNKVLPMVGPMFCGIGVLRENQVT